MFQKLGVRLNKKKNNLKLDVKTQGLINNHFYFYYIISLKRNVLDKIKLCQNKTNVKWLETVLPELLIYRNI